MVYANRSAVFFQELDHMNIKIVIPRNIITRNPKSGILEIISKRVLFEIAPLSKTKCFDLSSCSQVYFSLILLVYNISSGNGSLCMRLSNFLFNLYFCFCIDNWSQTIFFFSYYTIVKSCFRPINTSSVYKTSRYITA